MANTEKQPLVDRLIRYIGEANLHEITAMISEHPALLTTPRISIYSWENRNKYTPLKHALAHRKPEVMKLVLAAGDRSDKAYIKGGLTALMLAARQGQMAVVKFLIENDVPVDPPSKASGGTALLCAAQQCQVEVVQLLLEHGASVHATDHTCSTALMLAFDGHSTKSEAYPYNLDSYNEWGRARGQPAPVPYDEKRGLQVINMLLEAGADVSAQSESGVTLLHMVVQHNNCEILQMLLSRSVDVNVAQREMGHTALHIAVYNLLPSRSTDGLLHEHDTDPDYDFHYQPEEVFQSPKARDIIQALLDHGTDVNAEDHSGRSALSMAVRANDVYLVQDLLQRGASRNTGGKWEEYIKLYCSKVMLRLWQQDSAIPLADVNDVTVRTTTVGTTATNGSADGHTWLGALLFARQLPIQHVSLCEEQLVHNEGFSTEEVFATLPQHTLTAAYFEKIGITALGLQQHLIVLHREFCDKYGKTCQKAKRGRV